MQGGHKYTPKISTVIQCVQKCVIGLCYLVLVPT